MRPVAIFKSAVDVARVDPRRHAAGRGAQKRVLRQVAAVVIFHAVVAGDLAADEFDQLVPQIGPVQAGRDQDQDVLSRNARLFKRGQNLTQQEFVGDRPRDVADEDAGGLLAAGQLDQRRRADGFGQSRRQRLFRLGQRRDGTQGERSDEIGFRDFHFEARLAVIQERCAFPITPGSFASLRRRRLSPCRVSINRRRLA